jgi:hypothetical protein
MQLGTRGRWARIAFVAFIAAAGLAVIAPANADPPVVAHLGVGGSAFWDGTYVVAGHVEDDNLCNTPAGPCFDYMLDITAPAHRLRVAIDQPIRNDTWTFSIQDSTGATLASTSTSGSFSAEAFVDAPKKGLYRVHVAATDIDRTLFRMRAKLEGLPPAAPAKPVPLLPHLRAVPPYEFTFVAPANPANGLYPPDTANPPLDVMGVHPLSCTADEQEGDHVTRCLRFTSGPFESGGGPFQIDFNYVGDTAAQHPYIAYQVVHWSNGTTTKRPAGTYDFHYIHGHFHYDGILDYELYAVNGSHMTHVGKGNKSGFCPADEQIAMWHRFDQGVAGTYNSGSDASGGNCFSFSNGVLGLSTGWGDVYRWQRPGQYVDFDGLGDGYFVVQAIVDKDHRVMGTSSDNISYSYIHIVGESINIIERGLGSSPWDPNKQVVPALGGPLR